MNGLRAVFLVMWYISKVEIQYKDLIYGQC